MCLFPGTEQHRDLLQSCQNCSAGGQELRQPPQGRLSQHAQGHLWQLAQAGPAEGSRERGEEHFSLHCLQPSSFSLGHHFCFTLPPLLAAQPKLQNPTPASFLTGLFSHCRGHVLWQQAAPPHWRISSRNYTKSSKTSINIRSEKTLLLFLSYDPIFSKIMYSNSLNKCIFGLNMLALHRTLYKATFKRFPSLWEQGGYG